VIVDVGNKKNNLVVKSNYLIESSYRLTIQEQRIILIMVSMIGKDDEDFKSYRINIRDFMMAVGIKDKSGYRKIKQITRDLRKRELIVYNTEKKSELQTGWLSSAEYFDGLGYVELSFDPKLKEHLIKIKKSFTSYQLKYALRLRRSYSVRVYELLKQYQKIGKRYFDLAELKKFLWIKDGEYKLYGHFKNKIIVPAQKDLSERTDLTFKFNEKKVGRNKVIGIEFMIIKNELNENDVVEILGTEIKNQDLYTRLQEYFCLSPKQAQETLSSYEEKRILENLGYVEMQIKKGSIKNVGAYTLNAIKNDFRRQTSLFEIQNKAKQKEQQSAQAKKQAEEHYKGDYRTFHHESLEKARRGLSNEKLQALEAQAKQEGEQRSKDSGGLGSVAIFTRFALERLLNEEAEIPGEDEWVAEKVKEWEAKQKKQA